MSDKTQWPELVGKTYEEAEAAIKADNPDLNVSKCPPGTKMTRDFRQDRVRVMVDESDKVTSQPSCG